MFSKYLRCEFVRQQHLLDRRLYPTIAAEAAHVGGKKSACAQGFCDDENIALLKRVFSETRIRLGKGVDCKPQLQLGVLCGMAAKQFAVVGIEFVFTTAHEVCKGVFHDPLTRERQAYDSECGVRCLAHGIDIAEAMIGRNAGEKPRVVDECADLIDAL